MGGTGFRKYKELSFGHVKSEMHARYPNGSVEWAGERSGLEMKIYGSMRVYRCEYSASRSQSIICSI